MAFTSVGCLPEVARSTVTAASQAVEHTANAVSATASVAKDAGAYAVSIPGRAARLSTRYDEVRDDAIADSDLILLNIRDSAFTTMTDFIFDKEIDFEHLAEATGMTVEDLFAILKRSGERLVMGDAQDNVSPMYAHYRDRHRAEIDYWRSRNPAASKPQNLQDYQKRIRTKQEPARNGKKNPLLRLREPHPEDYAHHIGLPDGASNPRAYLGLDRSPYAVDLSTRPASSPTNPLTLKDHLKDTTPAKPGTLKDYMAHTQKTPAPLTLKDYLANHSPQSGKNPKPPIATLPGKLPEDWTEKLPSGTKEEPTIFDIAVKPVTELEDANLTPKQTASFFKRVFGR